MLDDSIDITPRAAISRGRTNETFTAYIVIEPMARSSVPLLLFTFAIDPMSPFFVRNNFPLSKLPNLQFFLISRRL